MSVRCTMTCPPMRMPLGEPDCCFFVERPVSRDNLELTSRSLRPGAGVPAIALCKCIVQSITRSASIRGRIPPRRRLAVRHLVDVVLPVPACTESRRAFGHAARSGPAVHRAEPLSQRCHHYFHIPIRRVVEIGTQVTVGGVTHKFRTFADVRFSEFCSCYGSQHPSDRPRVRMQAGGSSEEHL
jgi:hypothetical protein